LWTVKVNPTQFNQVLLNLCVNARDAMLPQAARCGCARKNRRLAEAEAMVIEGAPRGRLRRRGSGPINGHGHSTRSDGAHVGAVRDHERPGPGHGPGFPTVRGIVRNHAASFELKTELEKGTSFRIYLPAADGSGGGAKPGRGAAAAARNMANTSWWSTTKSRFVT